MHPILINDQLIEDDSKHYALVSYAQDMISQSVKNILQYIAQPDTNVPLDTKKRVKFIMEFFAVGLSLPIEDSKIMEISRSFYEKWLIDPSLFGNIARQNKYLRRIIKQLSLPFNMNSKNVNTFEGEFQNLLYRILEDYNFLHQEKGKLLEKETWTTLFYVLIGICDSLINFPFSHYLSAEAAMELKEHALDTCFSVINLSGIFDKAVWEKFYKYCHKWSFDVSFMNVWTRQIDSLFKLMLMRNYKFNTPLEILNKGVYFENPIDNKTISVLFHNILSVIDFQAATTHQDLLFHLSSAIHRLMVTAMEVCQSKSEFLIYRFPAASFLKLVGKFITFREPENGTEFDPAISVNIDTILAIISYFENQNENDLFKKLIAYVSLFVTQNHSMNVISFLTRANDIYGNNIMLTPFVAEISLKTISQLSFSVNQKESFCESLTSIYISSTEIVHQNPIYANLIEVSFQNVWNIVKQLQNRYYLICFAGSHGIPILKRVDEYFSEERFKSLCNMPNHYNFLTGCIQFVGELARIDPKAADEIEELQLLPHIINNIMKTDETKVEAKKFAILELSVLQLIVNLADWSCIFHKSNNVAILIKYYEFIYSNLKCSERKKSRHKTGGRTCSIMTALHEKGKRVFGQIQIFMNLVLSKASINLPVNDLFTRKLDSASEINEDMIIKKFNITDYKIYRYSVGQSLLVTFIEKNNGEAPLVLLARGAFGNTAWIVKDDYQGDLPTPKLSDEITPSVLPAPKPITITPIEIHGEPTTEVPLIPMSELQSVDKGIHDVYSETFSKWLNWNVEGFLTPFGQKGEFQRPRLVDFLTTLGLVENHNKLDIRPQKETPLLKQVIEKLDQLNNPAISPIQLIHVLPSDKSITYTPEHSKRMTPLMLEFLQTIGEPFLIDDKAADAHGLMHFITPVPAFPALNSFATILSPVMSNDADFATKIESLKPLIHIVFNETGFELNLKNLAPKVIYLIVKPTLPGLYHVWQLGSLKEAVLPFTKQETMSAKSLAFNISILLEMTNWKRSAIHVTKLRRNAISELCQDTPDAGIGPILSAEL